MVVVRVGVGVEGVLIVVPAAGLELKLRVPFEVAADSAWLSSRAIEENPSDHAT